MSSMKIEDKKLQFSCELQETVLNECGKLYLKLAVVCSPASRDKLGSVLVSVGDEGIKPEVRYTAVTDSVQVTEDNKHTPIKFTRNKFVFTLPKGLCTDGSGQKVSLSIAVHKVIQSADKGQRLAETRFVIYPRRVPPLVNFDDEQLYTHNGLVTFTRTLKEEGIQVHVGKVRFAVSLKWAKDEEEKEEDDDDKVKKAVDDKGNEKKEEAEQKNTAATLQEVSTPKQNVEKKPSTPPPSLPPTSPSLPLPASSPQPSTPPPPSTPPSPFLPQPTSPQPSSPLLPPPPLPPLSPPPLPSTSPSPPLQHSPQQPAVAVTDKGAVDEAEKILAAFQAQGRMLPVPPPFSPVKSSPATSVKPQPLPRDIESARQMGIHGGQHRSNLVAKAGHVEVVIIVHAASQLPKLPDGAIPKPYVIGRKKGKSQLSKQSNLRATHAAVRPSLEPSWEELIVVEMKTTDVKKEAVCLVIADQLSKCVILEYELGLSFLKPFHQYHLDLVQSVEPDVQGSVQATHLFISVQLKSSQLPQSDTFEFQGLEVTLVAMEESLSYSLGPLTAVGRVVPDFFNYVQTLNNQHESSALRSLSVQCPIPHPSSLFTLSTQSQFGHPQWTLPGLPEHQPSWNHTFLFCDQRELASIFTDTAALVIEFYPTAATFNGSNWSLPQCCGYCSLLLDMQVYQALLSDRSYMGIRVENVSLQLNKLYNREHKSPSVGLVLRLLTTVEPDKLVSIADIGALPTLETLLKPALEFVDSPPPEKMDWSFAITPPPVPIQTKRHKRRNVWDLSHAINEGEVPSHNALENILKLAQQPSPGNSSHGSHSGLIPTRLPPKGGIQNGNQSSTPPSSTQSDKYALSLLDSQQKEIESYKEALKRMGEEIVRLQEEVARLEMENSQFRQRLNMHEDATKAMVDVKELDDMSRADLIDKYVTLRRKLSQQVQETSGYREKLLKMQNDMIKQNDREQLYLKQRDSYLKQQDELQHKQEKVKKLERTCVEQEKALEKMERILRNKLKNNKFEDNKSDEVDALTVENARLKSHLEQLRNTPPAKTGSPEEAEKLRLQLHLEKAKGRVASLERELMEKAREWGKEKEVMRLRIGEQRNKHNHRSLPPLPHDRGGYSYNLSDDDMDDYPLPRQHQRHRHLSPLY